MVVGLETFRAHFAPHRDQFTLIGGAAASEWFDQAGLPFRATKDLDIVLILEALDDEFLRRFWDFIGQGRYQRKRRSDGARAYYRFAKPEVADYPSMLELFSRPSERLLPADGQEIIPIPPEEDASSLSAILMDEGYYRIVRGFREELDGLPLVAPPGIIVLKARAWLDLTRRRNEGKPVKAEDIRKHRNDVFRLSVLLPVGASFALPPSVAEDFRSFLDSFPPESDQWRDIANAVKATTRLGDPSEVLGQLKEAFQM